MKNRSRVGYGPVVGVICFLNEIRIIHRSKHPISRKDISQPALKVLYRLRSKGYWAFLVGGALRDLYRSRTPRDFDVATNATIPEIRRLFRNSKLIGKRFPIVHTYFGNDLVEISSLKAEVGMSKYEMLHADALQRDFTVNAIFYDINEFKVIDPLNAVTHLDPAMVVPIGDVDDKFKEDPIRMLRALKLVVKQGFSLGPGVEQAIRANAPGWQGVGAGRRYEELTRIFLGGDAGAIVACCRSIGLFQYMWPQGNQLIDEIGSEFIDEITHSIPVHFSRGSFAKHSHTHLWLQLYMSSGLFRPSPSPLEARKQFEDFIEPLGMPFRMVVTEAIHGISLLHLKQKESLEALSRESRSLMERYLERQRPDLMERLRKMLDMETPAKRHKKGQLIKKWKKRVRSGRHRVRR